MRIAHNMDMLLDSKMGFGLSSNSIRFLRVGIAPRASEAKERLICTHLYFIVSTQR